MGAIKEMFGTAVDFVINPPADLVFATAEAGKNLFTCIVDVAIVYGNAVIEVAKGVF